MSTKPDGKNVNAGGSSARSAALLDHRLADRLGAEERLDLPVRDGLEAGPLGLEHDDLRIVHCERELHTGDHEFPLRYASCVQLSQEPTSFPDSSAAAWIGESALTKNRFGVA